MVKLNFAAQYIGSTPIWQKIHFQSFLVYSFFTSFIFQHLVCKYEGIVAVSCTRGYFFHWDNMEIINLKSPDGRSQKKKRLIMKQVYHTRTTFINKKLKKLDFFFWKTNNYIKSCIFYKTLGGLKSKPQKLQAYTLAAKKYFLFLFLSP